MISRRTLGQSTLRVSPIGLGCMSLSGVYGDADDAASEALIHHAIDRGANHLDSADVYGNGHNEGVVGRAIRARRHEIVLATKFGNALTDPSGPKTDRAIDGRPAYVHAACEASLRRLGVEMIDLYYQHRVDPNVPIEETVGAMAQLVQQGKVRYLGLSEAAPDTIRRAHATHPITAVQTELSILYQTEAEATRATTRALGIGFVAYSPLGRGLLTGTIDAPGDVAGRRADHPRFMGDNFAHNRALVTHIEALARDKGATPSQVALAWVLAQGDDVVTIPGTRQAARLDENLGALDIVLTADELAALNAAIPPGAAAGTRYPAAGLAVAFR